MSEKINDIIEREVIAKKIGKNIDKLRKAMGWTQTKMAEMIGFSDPALANYIKGKRLPDIDVLINICALQPIKKSGLNLKIDDFLSESFDPERALSERCGNSEGVDISEHQDFLGNYYCYFYDQSKPVHAQDCKTTRELRFGVLTVYEDREGITGNMTMKAYATFYKESELENTVKIKKELDKIYKDFDGVIDRKKNLQNYYFNVSDSIGVYEGDVTFSNQHAFINIRSGVYSDNALMILYSPQKRLDSDYLGGIGSIASVAHGRMHMPTAQKIIVSRYELGCSFEEIADHLSLSSAPVSQTEEAIAITEICKKLYGEDAHLANYLDENDKTAILETRLNQLVRNYIEKNVCCVGSVSEEEDKKIYSLIKKYSD